MAIPFSKGSSRASDQIQVSSIAVRFSTVWATREAHADLKMIAKKAVRCVRADIFQIAKESSKIRYKVPLSS